MKRPTAQRGIVVRRTVSDILGNTIYFDASVVMIAVLQVDDIEDYGKLDSTGTHSYRLHVAAIYDVGEVAEWLSRYCDE